MFDLHGMTFLPFVVPAAKYDCQNFEAGIETYAKSTKGAKLDGRGAVETTSGVTYDSSTSVVAPRYGI